MHCTLYLQNSKCSLNNYVYTFQNFLWEIELTTKTYIYPSIYLSIYLSVYLSRLLTDGVCNQESVPSVSSINRIVRNKAAERAKLGGYGGSLSPGPQPLHNSLHDTQVQIGLQISRSGFFSQCLGILKKLLLTRFNN